MKEEKARKDGSVSERSPAELKRANGARSSLYAATVNPVIERPLAKRGPKTLISDDALTDQ